MNRKIIFLMCLFMAIIWIAGCECGPRRPAAAAPAPPVVTPAPPPVVAPAPAVKAAPQPVEEAPSKKLKKRVIKETEE